MDNVKILKERTDIESEACNWIAKIDGESFSEEDNKAFEAWVNQSPMHYETIKQLAVTWGGLNVLTCLNSHRLSHQKSRYYRFALASVIVLTGMLCLYLGFGLLDSHYGQNQLYHSGIGEQLNRNLSDGSRILLNTDSEIRISYSDQNREIWLLRGEAHFEVVLDVDRPFLVHADDNTIKAVGTAFTVYIKPEALEVLVTNGIVEVSSDRPKTRHTADWTQSPEPKPTEVKPLQKIEISRVDTNSALSNAVAETLTQEQMYRRLSWQQGVLVFNGESLEQVVQKISRYTNLTIEITDPAIKDSRIGGYFRTDDMEAILNALETSFNIRVDRSEDRIMLSAREQQPNYL